MRGIHIRHVRISAVATILALAGSLVSASHSVYAAAVKVQLIKTGSGWQLLLFLDCGTRQWQALYVLSRQN